MGSRIVVCVLLVAVVFAVSGCATIFYPSRMDVPPERRGGIDVGMLVLDILFTPGFGLVGLIVDFATGCIWRPLPTGSGNSPPTSGDTLP